MDLVCCGANVWLDRTNLPESGTRLLNDELQLYKRNYKFVYLLIISNFKIHLFT